LITSLDEPGAAGKRNTALFEVLGNRQDDLVYDLKGLLALASIGSQLLKEFGGDLRGYVSHDIVVMLDQETIAPAQSKYHVRGLGSQLCGAYYSYRHLASFLNS
jgi:hypothetical protein